MLKPKDLLKRRNKKNLNSSNKGLLMRLLERRPKKMPQPNKLKQKLKLLLLLRSRDLLKKPKRKKKERPKRLQTAIYLKKLKPRTIFILHNLILPSLKEIKIPFSGCLERLLKMP
jgi:hypothetical protein